MGGLFSKLKKNSDKELNDAKALSQQTNNNINNLKTELNSGNQAAQTDTPNIFTRFVNWFKSAFSSKKEPNVAQGTTLQNNVTAVYKSDANNTLPPEVTGAGVDTQSVTVNNAPEIVDTGVDTQSDTVNNVPEVLPETHPEYEQRAESDVKETPEKVTIGNMEFNTFEEDGMLFSRSGTMSVLGERTEWNTADKINLVKDSNSKFFGSGRISFKNDRIMCGKNSAVVIEANRLSYFFDQLIYFQNDIYIDLGQNFENLDSISVKKITLLKKPSEVTAIGGETDSEGSTEKSDNTENAGAAQAPAGSVYAEFEGDFKADSSGFKGEWIPADYPGYLFDKTVIPKIKLSSENENGLGFSLVPLDTRVSFGVNNIAKITGADPISVSVAENGDIIYNITEKYNVDLLSGLYTDDIDLPAASIENDAITLNKIEFDAGDIGVSGGTFDLSAKNGENSSKVTIEKLTYKDLTITNLNGTIDETGITAGANNFSLSIGKTKLSGSLEGFSWNPGAKAFSVKKFSIGSEKIPISDEIAINDSNLSFSLVEGKFSFEAGGTFVLENFHKGWIGVNTEGVNFKVAWDGENGFNTTIEGSIKVTVGKEGDEIASAEASKFSYDDGTFKVEKFTLTTTFDKLVSPKFTGSAVMTVSDLTVSTKGDNKGFDLGSMNVAIANLAYNDQTFVKDASVDVILKEGDSGEAEVRDGEKLDLGNASGALTGGRIAIYLLENKKGVKLSAKSFNATLGGAKIGITDFEAEFFGSTGDNNAKGSFTIDAGENICEFLNIEKLNLSASNFSIGSNGIKVGSVSTSLAGAKIANSLEFETLDVTMNFDNEMKFGSLKAGGSAKLGKIGLSNVKVDVSNKEDKLSANISADKITYGDNLLEINDVKGSFSKESVEIASADISVNAANTKMSGSLTNLIWSSEENFSVEKISVAADNFKVLEGFEVKNPSITASLNNNSFNLNAEATMVIKNLGKGIIKINDSELKLSLSLQKGKGEGENTDSSYKLAGSVEGSLGVVIGEDKASATISNIKYNDGEFSVDKFDADADLSKLASGNLSGKAALSTEKLSIKNGTFSVQKIELTASDIAYGGKKLLDSLSVNIDFDDKYELKKIDAKIGKDINFGGFVIKDTGIVADFDECMKISKAEISGKLGYKNYFSGEGSVIFGKDGFSIGELKNVIVSYGCFSGGLTSIKTSGDDVTFNDLSLKKKSDDKADFEGDTKSLTAKALRAIPNIEINLTKLEFKGGKLQKPSFDDISIKSFSATPFEIGNLLKANISYDSEKSEFTVSIDSKFDLPKGGDEPQSLKLFYLPFTILPLLQAEVSLFLKAKLSTDISLKATIARNADSLDFNTGMNMKANALFGIFGGIDLSLGTVFAKVSVGLDVGLELDADADLSGQFGFSYDSKEDSLFDAFKINKEATNFKYDLTSDLAFKVNLNTKANVGLPIIFDKGNKTLTHSWNLFNYNLMKAKIHGSISYDNNKKKYVFENDADLSGPDNTFGRYSPERTEEQINDFGDKLETLKKNVELINSLLEKSKGSTEIYGGLGEMIDKDKVKGLDDIKARIEKTFEGGRANALECHELMVKLNRTINGVAEKMTVNEANFEKVNTLVKDSQTALNIIGFGEENGKEGGMNKEKYLEFIEGLKKLLDDKEKLEKLAKLDPNAVKYMFGVFELDSVEKLVAEKLQKDAEKSKHEVVSPTKIDVKIYKSAMNDMDQKVNNDKKLRQKLEKKIADAIKLVGKAEDKKKDYEDWLKRDEAEWSKLNEIVESYQDKEYYEKLNSADADGRKKIQNKLVKDVLYSVDNIYKYNHQDEIRQWHLKNIELAEKKITVAQSELDDARSKLKVMDMEQADKAKISSAIKGFQEFVDQERSASVTYVEKQREKQGVGQNTPASKVITTARVENVKKMIQKLISSAEDEDKLKKGFSKNNSGKSELKDYSERLAAVRGGTDLYRTKIDGYGLKGNSTTSFQAMKDNRDKFKNMLGQRDKVYEQLSEFHNVIRSALDSWDKVKGFNFGKEGKSNDSVARVQDGFSQITDLVDKTDDAVKKGAKINETSGGVTKELERMGITEEITTIKAVDKEIEHAERMPH